MGMGYHGEFQGISMGIHNHGYRYGFVKVDGEYMYFKHMFQSILFTLKANTDLPKLL